MSESFGMIPGFMSAITAAQQGASAGITGAFALVTPAELASISTALGPIAVANMIPAFYEATGNNVTSGMLTAVNHGMLGASTHMAQASYLHVDEGPGPSSNAGMNPAPAGRSGSDNAAAPVESGPVTEV